MLNRRRNNAVFFFILAGVGLVTAWYFNFLAVMNAEDYLAEGFTSNVDWVLSLDLLIAATAGSVFIIIEGRRLKMRRFWLYIVLSGITAFAFVFPLFLGMRELKLRQVERASSN